MPNVTVGRGAIIGANSVVTHDIPPYTTAVGAPAHILQEKMIGRKDIVAEKMN